MRSEVQKLFEADEQLLAEAGVATRSIDDNSLALKIHSIYVRAEQLQRLSFLLYDALVLNAQGEDRKLVISKAEKILGIA